MSEARLPPVTVGPLVALDFEYRTITTPEPPVPLIPPVVPPVPPPLFAEALALEVERYVLIPAVPPPSPPEPPTLAPPPPPPPPK